ncbi:Permuted papain-like amidase enzyme, YaeF/YiiX, C92 family [Andreprevotia lacus DSM 23236]|uniref:Permuted papain-like amidase enzyme, YaeF/YiiX, C92 family n=1 Tax=Andreprevotia lacus DSM 23236 TaxID=1121001 RepID=A0A1W1XGQ0_9NEIS|nr:YaeF family permuted papain-like enzyme [Andreprevotia lacus]SMC23175.1 Permuted papain-like amidase enzyme, YaeF/YiiX, C92 family [Andreprevotia lacus DSM 23236]
MRSLVALLFASLLAGCAVGVRQLPDESGQPQKLVFQRPGLSPQNGGQLISAAELRPGDIILSAADGITSTGIRLFTLAPVSHAAVYLGDDEIAEAVGEGVRVRKVAEVLADESVVVAFRRNDLSVVQAAEIRRFAEAQVGQRYNYVGVLLLAPFSLERRLCDLPVLPGMVRDGCLRGLATIQLGTSNNERFFCSQFVLEAYARAGLPITDANSRWVSPADIMHMREDDVPSIRATQPLVYVGHLKFQPPPPVERVVQR